MGTPKALLLFDGEPLIVHIVATLRRLFAEVVVVAAPGQSLPSMPVTLVRDEVEHQGPVGGLCYGLRAARGDVSFVTSCDSAFLNVGPDLTPRLADAGARRRRASLAGPRPAAACGLSTQRAAASRGAARARRAEARLSVRSRANPQDRRGGDSPLRSRRLELLQHEHAGGLRGGAEALEPRAPHRPAGPDPDASIQCTVELFGAARFLAHTREVSLRLPAGATFSQVYAALAAELPVLVGKVIDPDRARLIDGFACNVNGLDFIRTPTATVNPGDNIVILSADAGG